MHYDPKIVEPMRVTVPQDVDIWPVWEKIKVPVLAIRGAKAICCCPRRSSA